MGLLTTCVPVYSHVSWVVIQDRKGQSSSESIPHHQRQGHRRSPKSPGGGQHLSPTHLQIPLWHSKLQPHFQVHRTWWWVCDDLGRVVVSFCWNHSNWLCCLPSAVNDVHLLPAENSSEATNGSREVMRIQYEWLFENITIIKINASASSEHNEIIYTVSGITNKIRCIENNCIHFIMEKKHLSWLCWIATVHLGLKSEQRQNVM